MHSCFRNALLAITTLVALASTSEKTFAQSPEAVTITVTEATEFAGRVLAPGEYILRKPSGEWYLTLEDKHTHQTIGFVRYVTASDRDGDHAQTTAVALNDQSPAKFAISSVFIPSTGRVYTFETPRTASQPATASYAGK